MSISERLQSKNKEWDVLSSSLLPYFALFLHYLLLVMVCDLSREEVLKETEARRVLLD